MTKPHPSADSPGGTWRCSCCGEANDPLDPAWRWTGVAWEHKCPSLDKQSGYMPARRFGDVDPRDAELASLRERLAGAELGGFLVLRKRDTDAIEAWRFDNETDAVAFYDKASAQWTETFLCRVVKPTGEQLHTAAMVDCSMRAERDAALAKLAEAERKGEALRHLIKGVDIGHDMHFEWNADTTARVWVCKVGCRACAIRAALQPVTEEE